MAERTHVTERVQIGLETTLGTPVAADKNLPSIKVSTGLEGAFTEVIPSGSKFPTQEVIGKEHTTAGLSGQPTYDELTYLFSSILRKVTPTANAGGSSEWVFSPSDTAEDPIASFTVEQGGPVRAHRFSGAVLTEMGLSGNRNEVSLSGSFMAQLLDDGVVLTADPGSVPQVPLFAKHFDVFMDDTDAALGTTKLGRLFSWEWNMANRFGPLWVVDSTADSWIVPVELVIDSSLSLTVEANAEGMALLDSMRTADTKFIRLAATSETEAGTAELYSFQLDFAGQINAMPTEFGDEDGIVAIQWQFKNVHDATWDKAIEVTLTNALAVL